MFDAGRRPIGRLSYWLLAVVTIAGFGLKASGAEPVPQSGPATTTVADTVYLADGTKAQGSLIITWPAFLTTNGTAVAGGALSVTLGANGALSVALVPNVGATPAGMYYTVVYQIGPGEVKTEYWLVPPTSPANLATVRTTPGSGVAAQPVSVQYVNSELATKANDSAVVHISGSETISGSKSGAEKKDAAMSFLENALQMSDAIAQREIVNADQFREGVSRIIDGVVECMNASAWAKTTTQPAGVNPQK